MFQGEYRLDSYTESSSNIDFPQIFYGKIKVFLTLERKSDGNVLTCIEGEAESIPPTAY